MDGGGVQKIQRDSRLTLPELELARAETRDVRHWGGAAVGLSPLLRPLCRAPQEPF